MTPGELRRLVAVATRLVASWPPWKRDILARSGRPTVTVSRRPVDNPYPAESLEQRAVCAAGMSGLPVRVRISAVANSEHTFRVTIETPGDGESDDLAPCCVVNGVAVYRKFGVRI